MPHSRPKGERPFVAAQRYVDDPMLINGRKFGIRVWALVLGPAPLRVYLHRNGLVLFSGQQYDPAQWAAADGSVSQVRQGCFDLQPDWSAAATQQLRLSAQQLRFLLPFSSLPSSPASLPFPFPAPPSPLPHTPAPPTP